MRTAAILAPIPHERTASILVLLQGGGLATKIPFVKVVTKVFDLELNKSHRTTIQGFAMGDVGSGATGVTTGKLSGTFVGVLVGNRIGAFDGIITGGFGTGAAIGTKVTNIFKLVVVVVGASTL